MTVLATLAPWQLLAWITGLELISAPLIIFTVNAIMVGYFKLKEQHHARMVGAAGKVFEKIGSELGDKLTNMKEEKKDVN